MEELPKIMVLVHKSLLGDPAAAAAIQELVRWNELGEDAPIKYRTRRELGGIMYIIDPAKKTKIGKYPANAYKLTDGMDW